jgi:hypothetical protein
MEGGRGLTRTCILIELLLLTKNGPFVSTAAMPRFRCRHRRRRISKKRDGEQDYAGQQCEQRSGIEGGTGRSCGSVVGDEVAKPIPKAAAAF